MEVTGTFNYMSPELMNIVERQPKRRVRYNAVAADWWAVGASLYHHGNRFQHGRWGRVHSGCGRLRSGFRLHSARGRLHSARGRLHSARGRLRSAWGRLQSGFRPAGTFWRDADHV